MNAAVASPLEGAFGEIHQLRALVRVAVPLDDRERSALTDALTRRFGAPVALDVEIDPAVIGGVWVRVGDIVIDGCLAGRLAALRQHLCVHCRAMMSSGVAPID